MTREAFYFDYAPYLAERLTTADIGALEREEDGWLNAARDVLSPDEYAAGVSQWQSWQAEDPAFRLLAYYDDFGGNQEDVPLILSQLTGYSPGTIPSQTMAALFGKAQDAVENGSLAGTQGGNPADTGKSSGIAMLALAAVALYLFTKR